MPRRWARASGMRCGGMRSYCSRRRAASPWSRCCPISVRETPTTVLYHLLTPLAKDHIAFNLFIYITFRTAGATVTALILAFVAGPWVIGRLRERGVGQVIRADGPAHQGKRGTPTMGGLIIILATVVPTLLWARLDTRYVLVAVAATLWM